jgi:methylenetetrahydrofolate reductase (NADPH)
MVKEYGITLAVNMIRRLVQEKENDIPGVHFFTLNLEKSVQRILETLQWTGVSENVHNKLIAVCYLYHCLPIFQ